MKFTIRLALSVLILMIAAPAFAGGPKGDCKLLGSWLGYDQIGAAWWTSTADGQNASHGTLNLEVPSAWHFLPGAVGVSELRGVWKKTGEMTYDWAVIGIAYDESATTLGIAKVSGKDILGEDCNTVYVINTILEIFPPDADPNTDTPDDVLFFPDHAGYRIQVNLPEFP